MSPARKLSNTRQNKKVRNATPLVYDGIQFRSKLEAYCYKKLVQNNIKADYEKNKYVLIEKFKYQDKTILPITYTPDFVGDAFIIECKGNMNDAFPIRFKLFKYYLYTNNLNYKLFLPRNQKDVDKVVLELMKQDEGK